MEFCSMLFSSLDGRGVWGRMDTCTCFTESFCCSPENIGYTPIQTKSFKKFMSYIIMKTLKVLLHKYKYKQ